MSLNRKRLAISVALVGAIAYPSWTGSWRAFPRAISAYDDARWRQTADRFYAAHNTTRSQYMAEEERKCMERRKEQWNKEAPYGSKISLPSHTFRSLSGLAIKNPLPRNRNLALRAITLGLWQRLLSSARRCSKFVGLLREYYW